MMNDWKWEMLVGVDLMMSRDEKLVGGVELGSNVNNGLYGRGSK
jgi:hypothetical protein